MKVTTETLSGAETETLIEFDSSEIDVFLKTLIDAREVYPIKKFRSSVFLATDNILLNIIRPWMRVGDEINKKSYLLT